MEPKSFTAKSDGLVRVLASPIIIRNEINDFSGQITGIWDTGATGSVITKNVVNALQLIPTGVTKVHTANGETTQNTYTVDIILPNSVRVQRVKVTEVVDLSGGCDALIGMDIINLGDFSVTNHTGKTCFSFRIPSLHEIDYVSSPDYGRVKVEKGPSKSESYQAQLRKQNLERIKNKRKNK